MADGMDSTRLFPSPGQLSGQYRWRWCGKFFNFLLAINLNVDVDRVAFLRVRRVITLQSTSPTTQFTAHLGHKNIHMATHYCPVSKLSDYYYKFDESPFYTWAACTYHPKLILTCFLTFFGSPRSTNLIRRFEG